MLSKSRQVVFILALLPTLHHILASHFSFALLTQFIPFVAWTGLFCSLYTSLTHLMSLRHVAVWRAAGGARAQGKLLADQVRTRGCWGTGTRGGWVGESADAAVCRRTGRTSVCGPVTGGWLRGNGGRVADRWNFKFNLIFNASNSTFRLANRMSRTFRNEDSGMFREIRNRWFVSFKSPNPYGRPLRRTLPLRSSPRQIKRCELLHGYLP